MQMPPSALHTRGEATWAVPAGRGMQMPPSALDTRGELREHALTSRRTGTYNAPQLREGDKT